MSLERNALPHLLRTLPSTQREQLRAFQEQLVYFNRRINLVSREDEAHLWGHHIVHSLALTLRPFPPGSVVVDWGTGGGLPAIPLAIRCPEVEVHAVDAVGKKVQAVRAMGRRLGLGNLHAWHGRAGQWPGQAHYSVSRATAPLAVLWRWHRRVWLGAPPEAADNAWTPGLLCLKGGDLNDEIGALRAIDPDVAVVQHPLEPLVQDAYFAEKVLVEVHGEKTAEKR